MLRRLYSAALGHAEIGSLADNLRAHLRAGDADRVVRSVAHFGVRLGGGAYISADTAEPQQLDLGLEDRVHHLGRRRGVAGQAQCSLRLRRQRDRLGAAWEDAAALGDQRAVVVGPTRTREIEQALTLGP